MASMALDCDLGTAGFRRLGLAVAASAAVHVALILAIRAGPPSGPVSPGTPIEARIVAAEQPAPMPQPAPAGPPSLAEVRATEPADVAIAADKTSERRPQPMSDASQPRSDDRADAAAAGAQVPLAADSTYHPVTALDRPPSPLLRPDVCYPHGATGEVVYELLIDEAGVVTQASVLTVKPLGLFTAAAAELCSKLRFSPAIKDGRAVRSRVRFVVGPG